jgi:protein disulfide-isomerase A6
VEAVVEKIPNHVKRLTDQDLDGWLAEANDTAKAILFTEKGATSALLRALAIDFLGGVRFGQIRSKEAAAVDLFGIQEFPTFVLLPGGKEEPRIYDGELKKKPMSAFLSQAATPNPDPSPADSKSSKSQKSTKSSSTSTSTTDTTKSTEPSKSSTASSNSGGDSSSVPKPSSTGPAPPPSLPILSTSLSLKESCLTPKSGTCILVLIPGPETPESERPVPVIQSIASLSDIAQKHTLRQAKLFPFYIIPETNDGADVLRSKLGLDSGVEIIALNGKRKWWRRYDPGSDSDFGVVGVEAWIDLIRLGEGVKQKLPEGVVVDEEKKPEITGEPKHGEL